MYALFYSCRYPSYVFTFLVIFCVFTSVRIVLFELKSAQRKKKREGKSEWKNISSRHKQYSFLNMAFDEDECHILMMIMIKQYLLFLSRRCESVSEENVCMEQTTNDDSTSLLDYKFDQFIFYPILTDSTRIKRKMHFGLGFLRNVFFYVGLFFYFALTHTKSGYLFIATSRINPIKVFMEISIKPLYYYIIYLLWCSFARHFFYFFFFCGCLWWAVSFGSFISSGSFISFSHFDCFCCCLFANRFCFLLCLNCYTLSVFFFGAVLFLSVPLTNKKKQTIIFFHFLCCAWVAFHCMIFWCDCLPISAFFIVPYIVIFLFSFIFLFLCSTSHSM